MHLFGRLFGRLPCLRHRVIVNLDDGQTVIQGVLFEQIGGWLVLKDAAYVRPNGQPPLVMDGDVVIECAKIAFVQRLGA